MPDLLKVTVEFSLAIPNDSGDRASKFCELLHRAIREGSHNAAVVIDTVSDGMRMVSATPADRPAPRGWTHVDT